MMTTIDTTFAMHGPSKTKNTKKYDLLMLNSICKSVNTIVKCLL